MASIKVKFINDKTLKDGTHPIAIQVIHQRKKKLLYIQHSLMPNEWDFENNQPNPKYSNYKSLRSRIKFVINQLEKIVLDLENSGNPFTVEDIAFKFRPGKQSNDELIFFEEYVNELIHRFKELNKIGNSMVYNHTKNKFLRYSGTDIKLNEIHYRHIKEFEDYLIYEGLSTNGISIHLRTLRAIINRAIKDKIIDESNYPFKNYSIKYKKTRKRAVNRDVIKLIESVDLTKESDLQLFKDIFMFSFYNRGMSFVDIAFLQMKNIENGRIVYVRKKTQQQFSIRITEKAQEIIDRYCQSSNKDDYIFPLIKRVGNEYQDYLNAMRLMNKKLKIISDRLNLDTNLSTYVARHSWATIAKRSGISTAIISEGLGHDSEITTQIYLDSFENNVLDDANEQIINLD